jgi:hypothetical protein
MIGFAVVHAMFFLALLPTMIAGQTQGDLPLYRLWAEQAKLGYWPVLDMPWVYPAGALAPIMGAIAAGAYNYQLGWFVLMIVANLLAVLALTGNLRRRSGYRAAWYWLAIVVLLAPVSMLRLEASRPRSRSPVSSCCCVVPPSRARSSPRPPGSRSGPRRSPRLRSPWHPPVCASSSAASPSRPSSPRPSSSTAAARTC